MKPQSITSSLSELRTLFGDRLQENVSMANYTTARVGGIAQAMLIAQTSQELELAAQRLWEHGIPFYMIGSGSNVLVSDQGLPGVVIVNRTRNIKIDTHTEPMSVWAESGANLGTVARQVALRGLSGLEWAATIPGSVGGAVYGNAGAFGGDMNGSLVLAEILHQKLGRQTWTVEQMAYSYRSSALKRNPGQAIILAARMKLSPSTPQAVQQRMDANSAQRRRTQPPGASLGSMFKNPAGDYAGRLIEAAGLKGARVGGVEISPIHANFFVNNDQATASDLWQLIQMARTAVQQKFGITLELEVELLGEWEISNGSTN
ncbi:UDP-N-acetylmuramate dehydrogenase [Longilinea arvoryzae]|uniref:UDP-N-acetylenolpyruvoylglucosamine reductase n=1 Tax=Longilinea arvoryzae TaxID=360412 RepID=A0A0S7BKD2_9CHLR|nr:UDP-N-acetylmuramate dehydrogenase [Longilinea arvoryzae]GAP14273.1 UDP-N-acetylmuramate dehydrogenase [Longilinea arvoryzae]